MLVEMISAYDRAEDIKEMFAEGLALHSMEESDFFDYSEAELADLKGKYSLPDGRLYLLEVDGKTAGCVALQPFNSKKCCVNSSQGSDPEKKQCSLKLLYVKPEFRHRGYGSLLCCEVLADAEAIGYQTVFLPAVSFGKQFVGFCEKLGFVPLDFGMDSEQGYSFCLKLPLNRAI